MIMDIPALLKAIAQKERIRIFLLDEALSILTDVVPPFHLFENLDTTAVFKPKQTCRVYAAGLFDDSGKALSIRNFPAPHHIEPGSLLTVNYRVTLPDTQMPPVIPNVPPVIEDQEEKLPDGTKRVIDL